VEALDEEGLGSDSNFVGTSISPSSLASFVPLLASSPTLL
jgi:hypothetical protein